MATLKELADQLGTNKQTITARLKELDLWDDHVSKTDRVFEGDAFAASAVADALKPKVVSEATKSDLRARSDEVGADAYATAIDALKTALSASQEQAGVLTRELASKNEQIARLQDQLDTANETIRRLSTRSWFDRVFGRGLPAPSTDDR